MQLGGKKVSVLRAAIDASPAVERREVTLDQVQKQLQQNIKSLAGTAADTQHYLDQLVIDGLLKKLGPNFYQLTERAMEQMTDYELFDG